MKIAVTYDNGQIFQHFGHTETFKVYEVEGKEIRSSQIIGTNGTGKPTFLKVLAGLTEPDAGTISRNPNVQVSVLSQNPAMQDDATILEQVFLHFPRRVSGAERIRGQNHAQPPGPV